MAHNDFIFSVLAEEHGFVGVLAVLALYGFVVVRSIDDRAAGAGQAGDAPGGRVCSAASPFRLFYNVTMSAGLAPVKGLTLPLLSYGGSSVIATLAGLGLILNVRMRRFTN